MGNTSVQAWRRTAPAVHPHARGEHVRRSAGVMSRNGSSPRPWGTRIPSCVRRSRISVHPHARGEHFRGSQIKSRVSGSSPRPWGTRQGDGQEFHFQAVHPHARGEHLQKFEKQLACCGSSPRPWGTRCAQQDVEIVSRFIPTPVGNTSSNALFEASMAVHPHARGEHTGCSGSSPVRCGSSPRPWGTQRVDSERVAQVRFIPTPVGNTMIW